jgi:hypothetical protein
MSQTTPNIEDLLAADPRDPGCEATLEVFDLYVEADLAGRDPAKRFPGPAAHLRSCPACRKDYEGLQAVVGAFSAADSSN